MDGALLDGGGGFELRRVPADVESELNRKAARRVASSATDAADCGMLLSMLGLAASDGVVLPRRVVLEEGVRLDEGAVAVCRPGLWANPFVLGQYYRWGDRDCGHPFPAPVEVQDGFEPADLALECCTSVELAVEWHAAWLPGSGLPIAELVGKDVACWCLVSAPCHGDQLLRAAWRLYIDRKKAKA